MFTAKLIRVAVSVSLGFALLVRKRFDAYFLLILGAGLVTLIGGFAGLAVLSRSASPFAFPLWTLRASIALTLGLGAGLVLSGVLLSGVLLSGVLLTRRVRVVTGQDSSASAS